MGSSPRRSPDEVLRAPVRYFRLGVLCGTLGIALAGAGSCMWFSLGVEAYSALPVLVLGVALARAAIRLGQRALGLLAIAVALPATAMSGFVVLFFALGGSR